MSGLRFVRHAHAYGKPVVLINCGADAEGGERVAARRTHLEDWLALLVFNHLISGAEAFVSAQLWDLPGQVSMERSATGTRITARIPW